ncbi:MAG: cell division ATP-binding protein FtsE [Desulfobulbus propionicus]|nr:MAG: cell division ATP-binding protein FtsE [Desulfobulbus propionicus]
MIDLIKVSKHYPPDTSALTNVSLTVHQGEMVLLTGKSGAGKSTLLRMLCRIERPSKGMVEVAGMDLEKLPRHKLHLLRRRIGMAYQDFKLLPKRTAASNIAMAMEVCYLRPSTIRRRTRELLERLDLEHKFDTPVAELSRGEQQRVALARALANKPELILADEPTGNLDAETTGTVMELLREHHQRGATLVIATHDTALLQIAGQRIERLQDGRLLCADKHPPTLNRAIT